MAWKSLKLLSERNNRAIVTVVISVTARNAVTILFKLHYYQLHLSVKARLLKLHRLCRLFGLSVCIFFARQMESDRSIYFMPPTEGEFKNKVTSKFLNVLLIHSVIY